MSSLHLVFEASHQHLLGPQASLGRLQPTFESVLLRAQKTQSHEQPMCEHCKTKLLEGVLPSNGKHWELCSMPTWVHCSDMGMWQ